MIKNEDIASELCITDRKLTLKCSKHHGTYIAWLAREILINEYDRLFVEDKQQLLDILRVMVTDGYKGSNMISDLFNNKHLTFNSAILTRLGRMYGINNPFGVHV